MVVLPFDDLLHAATGGVHGYGHAIELLRTPVGGVEARIRHGLLGGGHGEVDEAAHPSRHLRVHRDRGVEALDLGSDAHVEVRGIEVRDGPTPAHAGHGVGPERGVVVADGCDRAQAGHDGAA